MASAPSEILKRTKSTEKKDDKDAKGGNAKDTAKPNRRNSLLDFIAKNKKTSK
jgi:hypothetical protein